MGSTLVPMLLHEGNTVRVLDSLMYGGDSLLGSWSHSSFEFTQGDVRDRETVRDSVQDMDAIVNLAAIVGDPACARQPELAKQVNQDAALSIVEAGRQAGVSRFIFASTCSNYGRMSDPTQLADESWELQPLSLYAETKVAVEEALLDYQDLSFCPTVLRFATLFGVSPRMRFDLTVNEFVLEIVANGALDVFGEQFWRPYVHVRDAARAIVRVLQEPEDNIRNQVFNVGDTDQNYQKKQLVELIHPHAPTAKIDYVKREEDPRDYRVSFAKIKDSLGFAIEHTVASGIEEISRLVESGIVADSDQPKYRN